MKRLLFSILIVGGFSGFAGGNGDYSCEPVSEVTAQDYKFDVIPIKKGDQEEVGSEQNFDLSVYHGKIVVLNIFSPTCGWCMADLLYHTHFQKENWPEDRVVMVNLSYGPLVNEKPVDERREAIPQEVLDFVKEGYKHTRYGEQIDLKSTDFYHVVDTQTGTSAFDSIRKLKSQDDQTLLFPGLTGTPYGVIIDEAGGIRFRGHFTKGKAPWQSKFDRHYGFITSLVNQSCEIPPPLQVKKTASETDDVPLTKTGLRIVHSEGASCYDQDQIYKRCVDQKQLFEMAKEEVKSMYKEGRRTFQSFSWRALAEEKSMHKDLLLVYGYDNCGWCRAIHNLLYFSDESQKFQDEFLIRTIAKSSGNDTGEKVIEGLRSAYGITDEYGMPYLIRIDGQTGEPKDFILTEPLEQDFESWGWQGHNLDKVMERLLGTSD